MRRQQSDFEILCIISPVSQLHEFIKLKSRLKVFHLSLSMALFVKYTELQSLRKYSFFFANRDFVAKIALKMKDKIPSEFINL